MNKCHEAERLMTIAREKGLKKMKENEMKELDVEQLDKANGGANIGSINELKEKQKKQYPVDNLNNKKKRVSGSRKVVLDPSGDNNNALPPLPQG